MGLSSKRKERNTMTSDEIREAINLIAEYAQTKMLCIDERQKQLLIKFNETTGGRNNETIRT